jgi:oligogalacturonide lyase
VNARPIPKRKAELVTKGESNDQLLYFTSTSLLANDQGLVFISDRTGDPNLFFLDFNSGEERQLTDNRDGVLRSYVYFNGNPSRGFGKASVGLDATNGIAYYVHGREVRAVSVAGEERVLAEIPHDQVTAFTHVSADGSLLCVPTTDARAIDDSPSEPRDDPPPRPTFYDDDDPSYDVDERVQTEGLSSYLRSYDTATGEEVETVPVPRAWITHVQFSPSARSKILYNHEYCADAGVRRMWLWDGATHRSLREENARASTGGFRSRHDWLTHEMWERDGSHIVYHGGHGRTYNDPPCFIGRVHPETSERAEIPLPDGWDQYGHFTVGEPGRLVTDGYFRSGNTSPGWAGNWIALADIDWESGLVEWSGLVEHGSSWSSQDAHPHPIFDHACRAVYFTSDRSGKRAVYRIEV